MAKACRDGLLDSSGADDQKHNAKQNQCQHSQCQETGVG